MSLKIIVKGLVRKIVPASLVLAYRKYKFKESQIIYKDVSYREFLESSLQASRPDISREEKARLAIDMKNTFLKYGTRPDEYLLYHFDEKNDKQRGEYLPQHMKDVLLIDYYRPNGHQIIWKLRDKYVFYQLAKPYFKREVIKVSTNDDLDSFDQFCANHERFICKPLDSGCGVGIHICDISEITSLKTKLEELVFNGIWIIEELIVQDDAIAKFNSSSVNTVRLPSFRHGQKVVAAYPCLRFGRTGSVVDNAGQGGVFVSVDIQTGEIITNGYDELGHQYTCHPDNGKAFKGFVVPRWHELLDTARQAHLSLPEEQVYVAFDFALSVKGWCIVEGNWGDMIMQQTSLGRGMKKEFTDLLLGK